MAQEKFLREGEGVTCRFLTSGGGVTRKFKMKTRIEKYWPLRDAEIFFETVTLIMYNDKIAPLIWIDEVKIVITKPCK